MKYLLLITIIFSHLVFANNKAIEKPDPTNKKPSHELQKIADALKEANVLQKKADGGDEYAQYELARLYHHEFINLKLAFKYYQLAAKQGHREAQRWLGNMYRDGLGVEKNLKLALKYYKLAAKQNDTFTQDGLNMLAEMYRDGLVIEKKDLKQAVEYFRLSAKLGNVEAQTELGKAYRDGLGVKKNSKLAIHWLTQAADQGHIEAQMMLAYMYIHGREVEKNSKLAIHWLTQAAKQDHSEAQYELGMMYGYDGFGVEKNLKLAIDWFTKAAKQDHLEAKMMLKILHDKNKTSKNSQSFINKNLTRIKKSIEKCMNLFSKKS